MGLFTSIWVELQTFFLYLSKSLHKFYKRITNQKEISIKELDIDGNVIFTVENYLIDSSTTVELLQSTYTVFTNCNVPSLILIQRCNEFARLNSIEQIDDDDTVFILVAKKTNPRSVCNDEHIVMKEKVARFIELASAGILEAEMASFLVEFRRIMNHKEIQIKGLDVQGNQIFINENFIIDHPITLDEFRSTIYSWARQCHNLNLETISCHILVDRNNEFVELASTKIKDGETVYFWFYNEPNPNNSNNPPKNAAMKEKLAQFTQAAGVGVFGAGAASAGSIIGMKLVGFGAAGIVKGSLAAGIQAGIGNVAAGSWFALAQSVGATTLAGAAAPLIAGTLVVAGGVTAVGAGIYIARKKRKENN